MYFSPTASSPRTFCVTCTHSDPEAPFWHFTRVGTVTAAPRASSRPWAWRTTAASTGGVAAAGSAVAASAAAVSTNVEIARTFFHLVVVESRMRPRDDISHALINDARGQANSVVAEHCGAHGVSVPFGPRAESEDRHQQVPSGLGQVVLDARRGLGIA